MRQQGNRNFAAEFSLSGYSLSVDGKMKMHPFHQPIAGG